MNAVSMDYYMVVMVTVHDMTCIVYQRHGRSGIFSQVNDQIQMF